VGLGVGVGVKVGVGVGSELGDEPDDPPDEDEPLDEDESPLYEPDEPPSDDELPDDDDDSYGPCEGEEPSGGDGLFDCGDVDVAEPEDDVDAVALTYNIGVEVEIRCRYPLLVPGGVLAGDVDETVAGPGCREKEDCQMSNEQKIPSIKSATMITPPRSPMRFLYS